MTTAPYYHAPSYHDAISWHSMYVNGFLGGEMRLHPAWWLVRYQGEVGPPSLSCTSYLICPGGGFLPIGIGIDSLVIFCYCNTYNMQHIQISLLSRPFFVGCKLVDFLFFFLSCITMLVYFS